MKRKQYIVDRRFQLRTAFSIIGVVAAVSLIIIGALSASIVYNNDKLTNIYEIEKNIFQLMQDTSFNSDDAADNGTMLSLLSKNHDRNLYNISKIIHFNRLLIIALVISIVVQGVVLFFMIIKITHRISGPVYVMSGYMKEIVEGRLPAPRALRDRDELKEFYSLFVEMVEAVKRREK